MGESDTNYTDYNYTDLSQTNPISQSSDGVTDGTDEALAYIELIRENLDYDYHMKYDSRKDREMFEEIYNIICDVVCVKRKIIRIGGEDYPYELVKSRFLKLNHSHVEYVRAGCRKPPRKSLTFVLIY